MHKVIVPFIAGFALLSGAANLLAQVAVAIPDIVTSGGVATRPVTILSSDPKLQSLMERAFRTHGAYSVVQRQEAIEILKFEPAGANAINYSILNAKTNQTLGTGSATGANLSNAALRAGDSIVTYQVKIPGYFAGKIAFISDRTGSSEVYTSDLFFEAVSQLTKDKAHCLLPNFSPDGRRLLYTTYYRGGFPDIHEINLTSMSRTPKAFASYTGTNTGAVFSPNGSMVAMILSLSGNAELYTAPASGKPLNRITRSSGLESDPSFSPDGTRIVYASDAPGRPQLYEIPASGGAAKRIQTNISGYCAEPDWNPVNVNQIVFTCAAGREFELALWDMTTKKSRIITNGPGDAVEPRWLRDGRHVIYTERTGTYRKLMIVDTAADASGKSSGKGREIHNKSVGNTSQAAYVYP
ncbi:MAG: biopolymer transporter Tol [Verrucomicrobiota bacterium]|nr:biopolymer transporter Tol [Verrucomicrobiota bacterium]